ncbi:MAG: sulfotransferase [Xanthomonadales bacterium]|nr:sulfotransferase [Xanthomonadales bacterium]
MPPDFDGLFDRPLIVLAAPRSGSTLLFETLAQAPELWTVGGESHRLIEGLKPLNPMFGIVDSNRLTARHATPQITRLLRRRFARQLRDREGRAFLRNPRPSRLRFLEKTPKNALRQPFLEKLFPGALYLYLFRDPRANISSMLEAWKSGRWVTYPRLPGWRGPPWSLLLPPDWQSLNGRPLAEICAFQWAAANRIILDDLATLPADRWLACDYAELTARPRELVERICAFADMHRDERLESYLARPLPLSRFTQTAPDPEKWRQNETVILPLLGALEDIWARCRDSLNRRGA